MKRYCLALDLKDDPALIEEYKQHHRQVWPEIEASILASGVAAMEIFLAGNRLFMVMDVVDAFSFEAKAAADKEDATVQAWETLMWTYQASLPFAKNGEKWVLMEPIFSLRA